MERITYPLQRKWVVWEMWELSCNSYEVSPNSMQQVGEFQSVHEFWQHWNYIPHANPLSLFENPETKTKTIIEVLNQSIESICLFEDGFKPILDEQTRKTISIFYFDIDQSESHRIKEIWDKLVFSLIGETLPTSEDIYGCRTIDKKGCYRFEIWIKNDGKNQRFASKTDHIRNTLKEILGVTVIRIDNFS